MKGSIIIASLVLASSLLVCSSAQAAVTYDPSMGVYTPSTEYAYMTGNWQNFLTKTNWTGIGPGPHAFLTWDIDLASIPAITDAKLLLVKNNASMDYGIPLGTHIEAALITEYWDLTAGQDQTPPKYWGSGPATGLSTLYEVTEDGGYGTLVSVDVTSLMQAWQASPGSYYGIMIRATDSGGGVVDPGNGGITGDLVVVPEPATLALLAIGGIGAMLRRRK